VTPLVSPRTEPVVKTPKTALVTSYALAGEGASLLVVNVHALNFVSADTLALHLDQLEDRMRPHEGPILLGGDFNAWSDEKQERLRALAARLALVEVAFDGRSEDEDGRTKVFGNALDYAFVRGLRVESARVEVSERSDHNALVLELAVEQPAR
jgi:endonuclease/exonuclease/phosphatase (EEP) superfamily protein YafD